MFTDNDVEFSHQFLQNLVFQTRMYRYFSNRPPWHLDGDIAYLGNIRTFDANIFWLWRKLSWPEESLLIRRWFLYVTFFLKTSSVLYLLYSSKNLHITSWFSEIVFEVWSFKLKFQKILCDKLWIMKHFHDRIFIQTIKLQTWFQKNPDVVWKKWG